MFIRLLSTSLVFIILANQSLVGQELILNGNFENYNTCPTNLSQINVLPNWGWYPGHIGTADYFNACHVLSGGAWTNVDVPNNTKGSQAAFSGDGYIGFFLRSISPPNNQHYREYPTYALRCPMLAGQSYRVSMQVSLGDQAYFGTDNGLQVIFTNNLSPVLVGGPNPRNTLLAAHPAPSISNTTAITDKNNWVAINMNYIATGGETHIILGNFLPDPMVNFYAVAGGSSGGGPDLNTYIYLDDLSVIGQLDPSWNIPPALCPGNAPIDLNSFITGDLGGVWSGIGVTGSMFDPAVGSQSITYTLGVPPCDSAVTQLITVSTIGGDPSWNIPPALCPGNAPIDLNSFITGDLGGAWSGIGVTGSMFDPAVGSQSITYTLGVPPCDSAVTQLITVSTTGGDPSWNIPPGLCSGDSPIDLTTFITGDAGGTWSGTGVAGSMFDPAVGSQPVTYSIGSAPCDSAVTQLITINALPDVSFSGEPLEGCEPLEVLFENTSISPAQSCLWDFGNGTTSLDCGSTKTIYSAGNYDVTFSITSLEGCKSTVTYTNYVLVKPTPNAEFVFLPEKLTVDESEVSFFNNSAGATNYFWDLGDGLTTSIENPIHQYPDTEGSYTVTLWSYDNDCYDSSQVVIHIKDLLIYYVPNTFTPNGDKKNDLFKPIMTAGYDNYHLTIFNRWGEILFESYNTKLGWNGRIGNSELVQDGTYVWQIEFKETATSKVYKERGHVNVLK